MTKPLLLSLPGNDEMTAALAGPLNGQLGRASLRRFPDGETYVRIETPVAGREVVIVCTLDRPDDKFLPLAFLAATAADVGAARIGLVAPYLAYMRQDRRFLEGEGVTSKYFARLLSSGLQWLVTVDPHLHRLGSLAEIYPIPTTVISAAPTMSEWIRSHVERPVLIGPDAESAQWVAAVATGAGAPYLVLDKVRRGDRDVEVSVPDVGHWRDHTPVLVDDIISTARTMLATIGHLKRAGLGPPLCLGVHAVFAQGAYEELLAQGAALVVTCNTIAHPSNGIDLSARIAGAARAVLEG